MIDPRYLVPLSALPFQPHGATLAWECKVCGWVWSPFTAPALSCEHIDGPDVVTCLDLSAPPGDPPVRLDPLPWALAVLGRRLGVRISSADDIRPMSWGTDATAWQVLDGARYVPVLPPEIDGPEPYDPRDPNQIRRVVAEALNRTHVQKVSP